MASDENKAESGGGEPVAKDGIEEPGKEIFSKNVSENGESVALAKEIDEQKGEDDAKYGEDVKTEEQDEKGKEKEKEAVTPRERPARERKAVDRYWVASPASRSSGGKPISIEKGSGTPLRDIPNVAFKLSKRKPDDNLQLLHTILFGKKAKVHTLKKDIGQFSGFVWTENEEKQRAKMKEKIDKCVKEKLLHFCDVLNIPVYKSSVKKEDLTVKLLEFLESPHATTEELLADKDQKGKGQKRKATSKKSSSSKTSESSEKLDKKTQSGEKRKGTSKADEDNETDNKDDNMECQSHSSEEDNAVEKQESAEEETQSEEEKDESKEKTTPKSSSKVNSESEGGKKSATTKKRSPEKSTKVSAKSEKKTVVKTKRSADAEASALSSKAKGPTNKKQKVEETKKKKPVPAEDKPANKKRERKPASKEKDKGKTKKEDKNEPTNEELRAHAVNILKEVDFNTATLSDILRLLGSHFGLDLMHRKAEVKAIITDVIENMSNSDDDEEDEDSDEDAPGSGKE